MSRFAGSLIETARVRAGLTQAELARRARTSQSAIAFYEAGTRSPSMATLERIVRAAGFEMRIQLEAPDDHDASLDRWLDTIPSKARKAFEDDQRRRVGASR
ncbi:MAG: helix-turn-helix transcriptional regulator [Acidimicrobiales bacterium]|nr:helix-turn-helix transcriptional regulator [Acidimicrobiales bacterium]